MDAAERAAAAAEDQVLQAREQARVAKEQVVIAREQFTREQEARDEQEGPSFDLEPQRRRSGVHPVRITRTSGPEEVEVDVLWMGISGPADDSLDDGASAEVVGGVQAGTSGPHLMVRGDTFAISVAVPNPDLNVKVQITFECREIGGYGRTWIRKNAVELRRRPQVTAL